MTKKKDASIHPPTVPRRPEEKEDWPWPAPTQRSNLLIEDIGRILKQILDRIDSIEKRLENIEKTLIRGQRAP